MTTPESVAAPSPKDRGLAQAVDTTLGPSSATDAHMLSRRSIVRSHRDNGLFFDTNLLNLRIDSRESLAPQPGQDHPPLDRHWQVPHDFARPHDPAITARTKAPSRRAAKAPKRDLAADPWTVTCPVQILPRRKGSFARRTAGTLPCDETGLAHDEALATLFRIIGQERLKLARDLHDHAGQQIVGLKLGLARLKPSIDDPRGHQLLDHLMNQVDAAGDDLRRVVAELRPATVEKLGFIAALNALAADWSAATDVPVAFTIVGSPLPISVEAEVTLFRLAQEGFTNISKHAKGARQVSLELAFAPSHVSVTLRDDGVGFDMHTGSGHDASRGTRLGLVGMAERVALVRGGFEVTSRIGAGTKILAWIPVAEDGADG